MPDDTEKSFENVISDLQNNIDIELNKIRRLAEIEFRKVDEKIIEIESSIDASSSFEPLNIEGCIFFDDLQNFYEDLDGNSQLLPYGPFFLNVPYENFCSYLNKDFKGSGFAYQLKPNYQLIEEERKLFRLSRIYNTPIAVYSPYARRAVDIYIPDRDAEDFARLEDLNFRLKENNLQGKLLLNKKFYWNVAIKQAETPSSYVADDSGNLYEYRYNDGIDLSAYILPPGDATFDDELEALKSDREIILRTPNQFSGDKCELIQIFPLENKIDSRIFGKTRLRTQGDIEFVLKCLSRENYSCRFGKFGGTSQIKRYDGEHKYFTSADENLLRSKRKLPVCTVKFSGDELFLTDYANYVLNFLEERYPEFNWAGERDE